MIDERQKKLKRVCHNDLGTWLYVQNRINGRTTILVLINWPCIMFKVISTETCIFIKESATPWKDNNTGMLVVSFSSRIHAQHTHEQHVRRWKQPEFSCVRRRFWYRKRDGNNASMLCAISSEFIGNNPATTQAMNSLSTQIPSTNSWIGRQATNFPSHLVSRSACISCCDSDSGKQHPQMPQCVCKLGKLRPNVEWHLNVKHSSRVGSFPYSKPAICQCVRVHIHAATSLPATSPQIQFVVIPRVWLVASSTHAPFVRLSVLNQKRYFVTSKLFILIDGKTSSAVRFFP